METCCGDWYGPPRLFVPPFSRTIGCVADIMSMMLFQQHPASPAKLIPLRALLLERKENSFRPTRWRLPARCVAAAHGGFWNLDQSPFRGVERELYCSELPFLLGPSHPGPSTVPPEPFSTSVFKALA